MASGSAKVIHRWSARAKYALWVPRLPAGRRLSTLPVARQTGQSCKTSRRLAAILAADIAGYSALMSADEARTVRDLKDHLAVLLPMVSAHGGRVIDTA